MGSHQPRLSDAGRKTAAARRRSRRGEPCHRSDAVVLGRFLGDLQELSGRTQREDRRMTTRGGRGRGLRRRDMLLTLAGAAASPMLGATRGGAASPASKTIEPGVLTCAIAGDLPMTGI